MNKTEKGEDVRQRLFQLNLGYTWLIGELAKRGLVVERSYLCHILAGNKKSEQALKIKANALAIIENYERCFVRK